MPFAIGLRFYSVTVRRKGEKQKLTTGVDGEPCDLHDYFTDFVNRRVDPTEETSEPRTWFFQPLETSSIRSVHGYINYGTHGFESKFKDVKTLEEKYSRQATDLEEIPLYFQAWSPSDGQFAILAFQSFMGRSCVNFVRAAMVKDFADRFPGYVMSFAIMLPVFSMLDDAPVKSVTFMKPKRTSDKVDRLLGKSPDEIDYELTIRARRRGAMISTYRELRSKIGESATGYVLFEGREFESVKADVKMGSKRRTVGMFGSGMDAGLIDVSDTVNRDKSGHPTRASIEAAVDELMEELYGSAKT